jgi:sialic acid synthase
MKYQEIKNSENHVYIIGEIGQNHNGSVAIAKVIIDLLSLNIRVDEFDLTLKGMDAVKLTKRDLKEELTDSEMRRPYNSPHSFGPTYGEHRAALELTDEEHYEVYLHAKSHSLDFVETLCSPGTLSLLKLFTPDFLKVASRDLTNLPLLEAMAETKIPIILSTGMAGQKELDEALNIIARHHSSISILHCVSEYPTRPEHVNYRSIQYLKDHYPEYVVGYSDHTIGISAPVAAVACGARIIEKHITLDHRMKGTDQAGSLGPDGINRMVRDIRMLEKGFGEYNIFIEPAVEAARKKLERSIASIRPIKKGETIGLRDVKLLSPGIGFKWAEKESVIGKIAAEDIPANELITKEMIK